MEGALALSSRLLEWEWSVRPAVPSALSSRNLEVLALGLCRCRVGAFVRASVRACGSGRAVCRNLEAQENKKYNNVKKRKETAARRNKMTGAHICAQERGTGPCRLSANCPFAARKKKKRKQEKAKEMK